MSAFFISHYPSLDGCKLCITFKHILWPVKRKSGTTEVINVSDYLWFGPTFYLFKFWMFYDMWIFVNEAVVFNLVCKTVAAVSKIMHVFSQPIKKKTKNLDVFQTETRKTLHHILFHPLCIAGYQLTSAECFDLRSNRVVADQYCHYYPENIKPKPKLQECNLDPCPARSVGSNFKSPVQKCEVRKYFVATVDYLIQPTEYFNVLLILRTCCIEKDLS